ncbi:hypothetical protein [Sediminibacillus albus]|uniref:Uncharacterized protein n=1 Tax=Sediminibacillus albus TaxID=407036 RepID=A0A1G9AMF8_9BACI|nr:hypothetical protein [Sediminibacillus albus]SDK28512.1 hypothetical protein SAMN05216243_2613 [Sediminibacillus albus]
MSNNEELWSALGNVISRYIASAENNLQDEEVINLSILQLLIALKSNRLSEEQFTVGEETCSALMEDIDQAISKSKSDFTRTIDLLS